MKKYIHLALFLTTSLAAQTPVAPIVNPHMVFNNAVGTACAGCSLYSYAAGSTTPQATYTDSTGATQNTNPVIMGADGGPLTPSGSSGAIWLGTSAYKLVLIDTSGNTVFTVDNVTGGGIFPCSTPYAIQIANSGATGLTCDATITINTSAHSINVGTLPTSHVTIGALGTPTSWIFDTTTPATALASLGGVIVNPGTLNQLAYFAAAGSILSGTSVIPSGITGTTQSAGDNSTKLATTAYVAAPGAISPTSLTLASGVAMTGNQGTGTSVQHSTGSTTTGDLVMFDANGNTVDSQTSSITTISGNLAGSTRLPATLYQNTSGARMTVNVSPTLCGDLNACEWDVLIGATSTVTLFECASTSNGSGIPGLAAFVVPVGYYYKVQTGNACGGNAVGGTINLWFETLN